MASILIVEDHEHLRVGIGRAFAARGHACFEVETGERAIEVGLREKPRAAVIDLALPGLGGLGAFAALKTELPDLVGVSISGAVSRQIAERASSAAGMCAFLSKPFDLASLVDLVERQMHWSTPACTSASPDREPPVPRPAGMVGCSPAMQRVYRLMARVAPLPFHVLIEGETGTGKELVARALHDASGRRGRFVAINCAAVPRELLESELFGSERGAFTGATSRAGRFEEAHGGTLFLDEVGELPAGAQATLLRVLEEKSVRRLGASDVTATDARVVAATNVDLARAVVQGTFRADLLHRLRQLRIELPPLRERGADLFEIASVCLPRLCARAGVAEKRLGNRTREMLASYGWPGNVRELEDVLLQAVLQAGDVIEPADLPCEVRGVGKTFWVPICPKPEGLGLVEALADMKASAERQWIESALAASATRTEAAFRLGINVRTLYEKVATYGIEPDRKV